jgi:hypothetical protein
MSAALPPFWSMVIWGLIATVAMTTVLQGAQGLGLSRLSLPFLAGTFFTGDRRWAVIIGFVFYVIGGWVFAFLYFLLFASLGLYTWWLGLGAASCTGFSCLWPRCRCCPTFTRGWRPNTTAPPRLGSLSRPASWGSITGLEHR